MTEGKKREREKERKKERGREKGEQGSRSLIVLLLRKSKARSFNS